MSCNFCGTGSPIRAAFSMIEIPSFEMKRNARFRIRVHVSTLLHADDNLSLHLMAIKVNQCLPDVVEAIYRSGERL